MGLNAVRILSIVTLLLVFASQIVVMVTNIKAVNVFEANISNATDYQDCDYIECVVHRITVLILADTFGIVGVPCPINLLVSSGLLLLPC